MKHKNTILLGLAAVAMIGVTVVWSQQKAAPKAGGSGSASAHPSGLSWGAARTVEVTDPQYQMAAYTMSIPSNWKFAGQMVRPGGCHATGAGLKYTLESPDGQYALVSMPGATWTWSTDPQMQKIMAQGRCPGIDIDSASSFLVNIAVPNLQPNAKVKEVLPLAPEGQAALAKQLEQMKEQNAKMASSYGQQPQQQSLEGARVRIEFDRDGHAAEEMVISVVQCFVAKQAAMFHQAASERRTCSSRGITIVRAPAGKLDAFMGMTQVKEFGKGIHCSDAWLQRTQADQQAAFQRMQNANNAQFQANLRANQAQFERQIQGQKDQNAAREAGTQRFLAQDRAKQQAIDDSAHKMANYSLDRQDFVNPNTGQTIQASNQYNHQWISSDGSTLIQTDSHTFDPNGVVYPVSQSWSELTPK